MPFTRLASISPLIFCTVREPFTRSIPCRCARSAEHAACSEPKPGCCWPVMRRDSGSDLDRVAAGVDFDLRLVERCWSRAVFTASIWTSLRFQPVISTSPLMLLSETRPLAVSGTVLDGIPGSPRRERRSQNIASSSPESGCQRWRLYQNESWCLLLRWARNQKVLVGDTKQAGAGSKKRDEMHEPAARDCGGELLPKARRESTAII